MLRNVLRSIHVARLRGVLLFGLFVYLCSAEARQNGQGDETNSNGQSTGQQTDTGQLSAAASSAQEKHTLECSSVSVLVRDMGNVSVGCPKMWRSDRVFSVLDGILRDVDSMTIQALQALDANAPNFAVLDVVQNSLEVAAKYDQAQAMNNQFALQKLNVTRAAELQNYQADQQFRRQLIDRRNSLTVQLLNVQKKEAELVAAGKTATDASGELKTTHDLETALQTQIQGINQTLNTTPTTITDATALNSTAATTPNPADTTKVALSQIPKAFNDALTNALQQPTFPPAVRMDNVIDLLHQRIAREFSVMYDDLMRDPRVKVYLVEFDTSIQPARGTKDRLVRLTISLACNDCSSPPVAYELYPSAAAYNLMQGFNKTTHVGITGLAQTIFGWGLSASFQHDHSSLRSGLSQSLYIAGFGAGQSTFGWDFAPNPYERTLAPGLRTTYAIVRVPADSRGPLRANVKATWVPRDRRYPAWNPADWFRSDESRDAQNQLIFTLPAESQSLQIEHISYVPLLAKGVEQKSSRGSSNPAPGPASASNPPRAQPLPPPASNPPGTTSSEGGDSEAAPVIQVRFRNPVDPNLIITANDRLLRRVRDVRGRALYTTDSATKYSLAGNTNESNELSSSRFGLLEADKLDPDTWYMADTHTILLNVSRDTAGTNRFPTIRLLDPSKGAGELTELARGADDVRIGEWDFAQTGSLPPTAFQPLYTLDYDPGPFQVLVQTSETTTASSKELKKLELRLVSLAPSKSDKRKPIYLHDQAQVVLEADAEDGYYLRCVPDKVKSSNAQCSDQSFELQPNWALSCRQDRGAIVCSVPLDKMRQFCAAKTEQQKATPLKEKVPARDPLGCLSNFKVWLDEPPYYDRAGLWGDADPPFGTLSVVPEPKVVFRGKYKITEEELNADTPNPEYAWRAELSIVDPQNTLSIVDPQNTPKYCVQEFKQSKTEAQAKMKAGFKQLHARLGAEYWKRVSEMEQDCQAASVFNIMTEPNTIILEIPYKLFSLLPPVLTLEPAKSTNARTQQNWKAAKLPKLRDDLLPHDITISSESNKLFLLQGQNLRAVDEVYLWNQDDNMKISSVTSSFNTLKFDVRKKPELRPGKYSIRLALGDHNGAGNYFVDLLHTNSNGEEETQTLTIPEAPSEVGRTTAPNTRKSSSGERKPGKSEKKRSGGSG